MQDYGENPSGETEVQFRLTMVTLQPMLRSMAYISHQLSTPANGVAVMNLKVQTRWFFQQQLHSTMSSLAPPRATDPGWAHGTMVNGGRQKILS
ncbi:hypothetical protein DKX38_016678 [Salix brachista]|uniref:Uncharacterized protein n=1 Tax=Salix brachista TaxID=2182728 RepID=A0A5N5L8Q2_9ROSI|nr:hypothetical protein DKX38_016678 [Salix brachista]